MQIMPKTGEWIAAALNMDGFQESDLYDPSLNIRFGAFYLAHLYVVFEAEWQIFAAYNAGEGVVKGWIDAGILSAEEIPYPETKNYLRKIRKAVAYYLGKKFVAFD